MTALCRFRPIFRYIVGLPATVLILGAAFLALKAPSRPRLVGAMPGESEPFAHGPFLENADYGDHSDLPAGLVTRGSWVNGDAFTGIFRSGWYRARSRVTLMISGYPHAAGNLLALDIRMKGGGVQPIVFHGDDPREHWRPWEVILPDGAVSFRITATDKATSFRGWLAVSQPVVPDLRLAFMPEAFRPLLAFVAQAILLLAMMLALMPGLRALGFSSGLMPFAAAAGVAALGYLAFCCYFTSPLLGRVFSWTVLGGSIVALLGPWSARQNHDEFVQALGLAFLIGLSYVALTCLFGSTPFSGLAANRFVLNMPVDNQIPQIFADRLWAGKSPRHLLGDWLSSDRPPLQTGWLLLTRPAIVGLGFDRDTEASMSGIWFQLLWVPALWALFRRLGSGRWATASMIAAMAFTGFQLFYTIYTWPKLGAAALVLGAFIVWQPKQGFTASSSRRDFAIGGIWAALGWLSHGGVAFSLVGLAPLALFWSWRERQFRHPWLIAAICFIVVSAPWFAYQKLYEPPGNRLMKWHLAGVIPPDSRGFAETLFDSYRQIGWHGALANRWSNLRLQYAGNFGDLLHFKTADDIQSRRSEELGLTARIFSWWLPAALILPWFFWRQRKSPDSFFNGAALWWLAGWLAWLALMFLPGSADSHLGTLVTQLLGFALLIWTARSWRRAAFLVLASLQIAEFLGQWVTASPGTAGTTNFLPVVVAAAGGAILIFIIFRGALAGNPSASADQTLP